MQTSLMILGLFASLSLVVHADEGEVQLLTDGTELQVRILGSDDDDWHIESSLDLFTWERVAGFGTLLSGDDLAPVRSVMQRVSFMAVHCASTWALARFQASSAPSERSIDTSASSAHCSRGGTRPVMP